MGIVGGAGHCNGIVGGIFTLDLLASIRGDLRSEHFFASRFDNNRGIWFSCSTQTSRGFNMSEERHRAKQSRVTIGAAPGGICGGMGIGICLTGSI